MEAIFINNEIKTIQSTADAEQTINKGRGDFGTRTNRANRDPNPY